VVAGWAGGACGVLYEARKRAGNGAKRVFGVRFFTPAVMPVSAAGLAIFGILGCRKHPVYVTAAD
jgi:hypothetical protein